MDIEKRKIDFQDHHKNRLNILFHILCGLLYLSFLFSLLPSWTLWIYSGIVLYYFPHLSALFGLIVLFISIPIVNQLRLSTFTRLVLLVVIYFLPEVSHFLTRESTVLQLDSLTLYDCIDNFFFLYPQSLLSLTKARELVSRP